MSHAVEPNDLQRTAAPYGNSPYLLYVGTSGTARVNHVHATVISDDGGAVVRCAAYGRGVPDVAATGAQLSLLWPAHEDGGFSLIADGTGTVADDMLELRITGAVLHRPAPVDGGDASC